MDDHQTPKTKKKKIFWGVSETFKFLAIWKEYDEKLRGIGPKKEVYQDMAAKLEVEGVIKQWDDIQKKVQNMKQAYEKYKPGVTGASPSNWIYYQQCHEILETSHFHNQGLAPIVDTFKIPDEANDRQETEKEPEEVIEKNGNLSPKEQSITELGELKRESSKRGKKRRATAEDNSDNMAKILKEMQQNHDRRMEELSQSRNNLQNQMEMIGNRLLNVLDILEKKLNN